VIGQAHQLYCHLTGQTVRLGFDRERQWYELLRQGHTLADVRAVILYGDGFRASQDRGPGFRLDDRELAVVTEQGVQIRDIEGRSVAKKRRRKRI
jgi:hypothetical protein